MKFKVGDRVLKHSAHWQANAFDQWARGVGIGVVVEPPYPLPEDEVDVRWPGGRCFESVFGLERVPPEPAWPESGK